MFSKSLLSLQTLFCALLEHFHTGASKPKTTDGYIECICLSREDATSSETAVVRSTTSCHLPVVNAPGFLLWVVEPTEVGV